MSAIEIPNAFVAAGAFDPANISGLTNPPPGGVLSQEGFQPFDPATTPAAPKGGFTKIQVGLYVLKLLEGLDTLEGNAILMPFPPPPGGGANDGVAIIYPAGTPVPVPIPTIDDGKSILVQYSTLTVNAAPGVVGRNQAVDAAFSITVLRYATGRRVADYY
jgi:hypothetical protein